MTADTIALVTGANKGIGFEIAGQLAALGVTVLLGARDADKGKAAAAALREQGGDVREIVLDVTDPVTIADAAARIEEGFGRLDVLVNNAGISGGHDTQRPGAVDLGAVRMVFETNLFGVVAVTEAMLPLLRRSAAARIVNISSGTGSLTWMTDTEHYFASKRARRGRVPGFQGRPEHAHRAVRQGPGRGEHRGQRDRTGRVRDRLHHRD